MAFSDKIELLTSNKTKKKIVKIKLIKNYVWRETRGCKQRWRRSMGSYRNVVLEMISRMDRKTYKEVLDDVENERNLMGTITTRRWLGTPSYFRKHCIVSSWKVHDGRENNGKIRYREFFSLKKDGGRMFRIDPDRESKDWTKRRIEITVNEKVEYTKRQYRTNNHLSIRLSLPEAVCEENG